MPKIAVIMGSDSDFPVLKEAIKLLKDYDIDVTVKVMSAHRTPEDAANFAKNAKKDGYEVLLAAAGKAAHLGGVLAAFTTIPVIGIPIKSSTLDGLDALLSIVQMPKGIPVATVAIDGAYNAALLALEILSIKYDYIADKLQKYKSEMAEEVREKDKKIQQEINNLN